MKLVLGETFMPLGCVILEGGGNAELRSWKTFGQWVNTIRRASPKSVIPEHALYAARKIDMFIQALKGGAGPAHRWYGKEAALPELPLIIRDSQGNFTADPQCVEEIYAHEWKLELGGEDAIGLNKEIESIRALRVMHVEEARAMLAKKICGPEMFAKLVSLSRPRRRSASTSTHSKTSLFFPDNALDSLGEIVRQCFVKLAIPIQSFLTTFARQEKRREQTNRHLTHHVPLHHAFGLKTHQPMGCQVRW